MPPERALVIGILDAFQAAERAGAQALGCWLATCGDPALRGGLRVIRARDERHAALAEARLRALGGVPGAGISRELAALCSLVADPSVSDRSKLGLLVACFPAHDSTPLAELGPRLEGDDETRTLLETIGEDEQASLEWLRRMRDARERDGA